MEEAELEVIDAGSADAQWAMRQYFTELDERFVGGFAAADVEAALREARSNLNPPAGRFLVARRGGTVVACGGLALLDEETAEIKRMWVAPEGRGLGLGRRLLARLEQEAAALGRRTAVLDTNGVLLEAIAMYERAGYRHRERYNDNPYAQIWFTKVLSARRGDAGEVSGRGTSGARAPRPSGHPPDEARA